MTEDHPDHDQFNLKGEVRRWMQDNKFDVVAASEHFNLSKAQILQFCKKGKRIKPGENK